MTLQIRNLLTVLALLSFFTLPHFTQTANSAPFTAIGAITAGAAAAIYCEGLVADHMAETPESDEPWYLIQYHVGVEDITGFVAGTVCAIPASVVGGAAGAMVDATALGTVTTTATGVVIYTTAKGVKYLYKLTPAPKYADKALKTSKVLGSKARKAIAETASAWTASARQYFGKFKGWKTATPAHLRRHMPQLYSRQYGRDALCDVPLPPLYVGPLWNRQLNRAIEVDHALPKVWGGTNDLSNLQLTHRDYNRAKGARVGISLENAKKQFCPI